MGEQKVGSLHQLEEKKESANHLVRSKELFSFVSLRYTKLAPGISGGPAAVIKA